MGAQGSKPAPALSKPVIVKANAASIAAVLQALSESAAFQELAAIEAKKGQTEVAEKLLEGFKLASKNPTEKEIMLSLSTTLDKMVAEAKPSAPATTPSKKKLLDMGAVMPMSPMTKAKPLSKPLVLQKDAASDKAIIAAFAGEPDFATLTTLESTALMGQWFAAKRVVENFKLASKNPTAKECFISIESTATKLAAEDKLPPPPGKGKVTKELIKKGGKPALSAVIAMFAKNAGFAKLAAVAAAAPLAEASAAYQGWFSEPLAKAGERRAARVLAENFKLASKAPTDKECKISLGSTLEFLVRL